MGTALIASALLLFVYNNNEDIKAGRASQRMLDDVIEAIKERRGIKDDSASDGLMDLGVSENNEGSVHSYISDPYSKDMEVVEVGEYKYIGYISIPKLESLELPILSEWSYELLKDAPCRFSGSVFTDDLVLLGHNYTRHFGKLDRLKSGDRLSLIDMNGVEYKYEVIGVELLPRGAVEEMTSGEYDLSLFTCDYSGNNRFTVRCNRI